MIGLTEQRVRVVSCRARHLPVDQVATSRGRPCAPGVVESAFETPRERERIDADIAHLTETRNALDMLLRANSQHQTELSAAPEPVARSA